MRKAGRAAPSAGAGQSYNGPVGAVPKSNPFRPGTGKFPPLFAGREKERKVLLNLLGRTKKGDSPDAPGVVHGARGNGKTALLRWLKRECDKRNADCVLTNASAAGTLDHIADAAIPRSRFEDLIPEEFGANVGVAGATWKLKGREPAFQRALLKRCRNKPLVFLLDEAHMVKPDVLRHLLNATQHVQGEEQPFMLVLAGTPQLRRALNEADASFWTRVIKISLGLLERKHSREALLEPFGPRLDVDEGSALNRAFDLAQDYPYFIQVMGSELWEAHSERIDQASLEQALPRFQKEKRDYYLERQLEIRLERGMEEAAAAVAKEFEKAFAETGARKLLVHGVEKAAGKHADGLRDLGVFVERAGEEEKGEVEGTIVCEPGIPSLMDHVRQGWEHGKDRN